MTTGLGRVKNPLEALTDIELRALIAANNKAPQVAPGLFAGIEGACDCELNRRAGHEYDPLPPEAAIDPNEMR